MAIEEHKEISKYIKSASNPDTGIRECFLDAVTFQFGLEKLKECIRSTCESVCVYIRRRLQGQSVEQITQSECFTMNKYFNT